MKSGDTVSTNARTNGDKTEDTSEWFHLRSRRPPVQFPGKVASSLESWFNDIQSQMFIEAKRIQPSVRGSRPLSALRPKIYHLALMSLRSSGCVALPSDKDAGFVLADRVEVASQYQRELHSRH